MSPDEPSPVYTHKRTRVNKLVTVQPPKSRYQGAIGDLVVGRVTEVAAKRWKVDVRGHKVRG